MHLHWQQVNYLVNIILICVSRTWCSDDGDERASDQQHNLKLPISVLYCQKRPEIEDALNMQLFTAWCSDDFRCHIFTPQISEKWKIIYWYEDFHHLSSRITVIYQLRRCKNWNWCPLLCAHWPIFKENVLWIKGGNYNMFSRTSDDDDDDDVQWYSS